jgi:hypothetical protein
MRDQWYGDKRDLVKWGVLLSLAADHDADRILQVGYFRPSVWPPLQINGQERAVPEAVLRHFRDVRSVTALTTTPRIEVVGAPFVDRRKYADAVLGALAQRSTGETCVVFLDPDTGLAPRNGGLVHVLDSELSEIWQHMPLRDVLVFYQHQTNRNATPWIQPKREQFERALGLPIGTAKVATGTAIANDVAFFYVCKGAV